MYKLTPEELEKIQAKSNEYFKKILYNADPNCNHVIEALWSGVRCKKCHGWYCL